MVWYIQKVDDVVVIGIVTAIVIIIVIILLFYVIKLTCKDQIFQQFTSVSQGTGDILFSGREWEGDKT